MTRRFAYGRSPPARRPPSPQPASPLVWQKIMNMPNRDRSSDLDEKLEKAVDALFNQWFREWQNAKTEAARKRIESKVVRAVRRNDYRAALVLLKLVEARFGLPPEAK